MAEKMTNLSSASVDAIPKGPKADEFVKATKGSITGASPFQASTSNPNPSTAFKTVSDMLESCGYRVVSAKTEKNGSLSINFDLADGGTEIVDADQHQPLRKYEWEVENQKVIRFLNAPMVTEFRGEDGNVMLVKMVNLPPEIEKKDVGIAVENGKLVIELHTVQSVVEQYGQIRRFAEFPVGGTASATSTLMEGHTLTVSADLEKPKPVDKPKSSSGIWRSAKGALTKALPGCLLVGCKMGFDQMTNDDPKAEPSAEPTEEQE